MNRLFWFNGFAAASGWFALVTTPKAIMHESIVLAGIVLLFATANTIIFVVSLLRKT